MDAADIADQACRLGLAGEPPSAVYAIAKGLPHWSEPGGPLTPGFQVRSLVWRAYEAGEAARLRIMHGWRAWEPDQRVKALVEAREAARAHRDWVAADRIRDELRSEGVVVDDTPTGPRVRQA